MTPAERATQITKARARHAVSEIILPRPGFGSVRDADVVAAYVEEVRKDVAFLLDELAATRRALYLAADALQHCRGCRTCGEDGCDGCDRCTAAATLPEVRQIMDLDLAVWHNGYDWVIAPIGDGDAGPRAVMRAHSGGDMSDDDCDGDGWERLSDDTMLPIRDEEDRTSPTTTLTCREWIARNGVPGFLCSTEY